MLLAQMADVLMLEEGPCLLPGTGCADMQRAEESLSEPGGRLLLQAIPKLPTRSCSISVSSRSSSAAQVLQNLIRDIQQHDTHVTTGNLCTRYILDVLADDGEIDLAYALVTQTTYPSWGYMLACGATTVWERWEYVDSGELVGMASHEQPMYAAVSGWFYRCLAGLRPDACPFSRFTLQPYFPRELPEIRCTLHTVKGEIRVEWTQRGGEGPSVGADPVQCLRRMEADTHPAQAFD